MAFRPFVLAVNGPILTLVFGSAQTQHAALSRLECFYESKEYANTYLNLDAAFRARVCRGYEAFNLPTDIVSRWLEAMQDAEGNSSDEETSPWWHSFCNAEEIQLLDTLFEIEPRPSYLISSLVHHADVALAHERLHALYHLSQAYRELLASIWEDLPRNIQNTIQYDLKMRGYKEAVYQDEFGAYLGITTTPGTRRGDPVLEFGNKSIEVCRDVRKTLLHRIPEFWRIDVGIDEASMQLSPAFLLEAKESLTPAHKSNQATSFVKGKNRRTKK
ncbi:enhancer of mRNA decapping [Malassezia yamatoensis]|uniref:Enhancer of mRNA decapping n=1 Tax=Malassezia yamatoensis TaxID=253288 RepID=A0AAJ5YR14_9BASI|nr:enhancer of mRNA decapping [Malassezia yamatoensis]